MCVCVSVSGGCVFVSARILNQSLSLSLRYERGERHVGKRWRQVGGGREREGKKNQARGGEIKSCRGLFDVQDNNKRERQLQEIYSYKSVLPDYSKPGKLFILCVSDGAAGDFFFFYEKDQRSAKIMQND